MESAHLLHASSELGGYARWLELILYKGQKTGNYIEVLGLLLSIEADPQSLSEFETFQERYLDIGGEPVERGWQRASRVYTTNVDKPSKPSYLKRLVDYPDTPKRPIPGCSGINQLEKISDELAKKPGFSNLSFTILRPADLYDQFRPGYVPCAIAGDFKFRNARLHMSVMFRTCDALTVGYADIMHLRGFQQEVLRQASSKSQREVLRNASVGSLNLYFARTFIERSLKIRSGVKGISRRRDGRETARRIITELDAQHLLAQGRS